MKNTLDGISGRLDMAEGKISEFEGTETIQNETKKKESLKSKDLVSWD